MRTAPANRDLGRYAFGAVAILIGTVTVLRPDLGVVQTLGNLPHRAFVTYVAGAVALAGGLALERRGTAQLGALALGVLYLCFTLLWVPGIAAAPLAFDRWANLFERLSIFSGALIACASPASGDPPWAARAARFGRIAFGVCVVSFTLEQAFNLRATADLVPKYMPLGQMFWAVATTVAFALAAVAIVSGRQARTASRLLTAMIVLFGLLIWIPALFADPRSHFVWSETVENFAIGAAAWVLADDVGSERSAATSGVR